MNEAAAINAIRDSHPTKVKSPQTNGICERFHKTILQEFYQVTFRKKIYETIEQLQNDLDEWIDHYKRIRRLAAVPPGDRLDSLRQGLRPAPSLPARVMRPPRWRGSGLWY